MTVHMLQIVCGHELKITKPLEDLHPGGDKDIELPATRRLAAACASVSEPLKGRVPTSGAQQFQESCIYRLFLYNKPSQTGSNGSLKF